jgi:hypothetical protein
MRAERLFEGDPAPKLPPKNGSAAQPTIVNAAAAAMRVRGLCATLRMSTTTRGTGGGHKNALPSRGRDLRSERPINFAIGGVRRHADFAFGASLPPHHYCRDRGNDNSKAGRQHDDLVGKTPFLPLVDVNNKFDRLADSAIILESEVDERLARIRGPGATRRPWRSPGCGSSPDAGNSKGGA